MSIPNQKESSEKSVRIRNLSTKKELRNSKKLQIASEMHPTSFKKRQLLSLLALQFTKNELEGKFQCKIMDDLFRQAWYPDDVYMTTSASGLPLFSRVELVEKNEITSYFSRCSSNGRKALASK